MKIASAVAAGYSPLIYKMKEESTIFQRIVVGGS